MKKPGSMRITLLHELYGMKTRNWPIRSAFYTGHNCKLIPLAPRSQSLSLSLSFTLLSSFLCIVFSLSALLLLFLVTTLLIMFCVVTGIDTEELNSSSPSLSKDEEPLRVFPPHPFLPLSLSLSTTHNRRRRGGAFDLDRSMILASGSANKKIPIFDVGRPQGQARLLQLLEGHADIVYSVDFHPIEPLLASASADGVVKLWMPRG